MKNVRIVSVKSGVALFEAPGDVLQMTLTRIQKVSISLMDGERSEDRLRRSQAGDLDAFDSLVAEHYERAFQIAYRILGHREAAEDATQEAFLKAWNALSRFNRKSRFSTWLHTIVIRHAFDAYRSRKADLSRRLSVESEEDPIEALDRLQNDASIRPSAEWDRRLAIRDALMRIPEKLREVVQLYYFADCTLSEIADALGLPVSTVFQRLRSGNARLQRLLGDWEHPR